MTKVRRQSVYIAGKYRSKYGFIGRLWHVWKAGQVGMRLKTQGYVCFNPIVNWGLFGLFDKDDSFWLAAGLKLLPDHEIIYMMKGWERSVGARIEILDAGRRGLEIIYEYKNDYFQHFRPIDIICKDFSFPVPRIVIEDCHNVNCKLDKEANNG